MSCSVAGGFMAGFGFIAAITLVCACLVLGMWLAVGGRVRRRSFQTPDE
jgi:hypothetical protein